MINNFGFGERKYFKISKKNIQLFFVFRFVYEIINALINNSLLLELNHSSRNYNGPAFDVFVAVLHQGFALICPFVFLIHHNC